MKLFEYKCRECKKIKEIWDKDVPKRPICCNVPMVRVYSVLKPVFNCDMRR